MKINNRGFGLVWAVVGVAVAALGTGAVIQISRANAEQRQQLAIQNQREAYATIQQEIALEGIDPTRIVNPLGEVISGPRPGSGGRPSSTASRIGVSILNMSTQSGAANIDAVSVRTATSSGERSSGLGFTVMAGGSAASAVTALNPPAVVVGPILQATQFPATNWIVFPGNPPGTVYRYTTNGSTPTASSPIWTATFAGGINIVNFPDSITIAAFNPDPAYSMSSVSASGSLVVQLPAVGYTRAAGSSNGGLGFTFADVAGGFGLNLVSAVTLPALSGVGIQFTVNGSNPVGGTVFASSVVPPFANWTPSGAATVRAVMSSTNPRYLSGASATWTLNAVAVRLPSPLIVTSNAAPLPNGTMVSVTPQSGHGASRIALDAAPHIGSPNTSSIRIGF